MQISEPKRAVGARRNPPPHIFLLAVYLREHKDGDSVDKKSPEKKYLLLTTLDACVQKMSSASPVERCSGEAHW